MLAPLAIPVGAIVVVVVVVFNYSRVLLYLEKRSSSSVATAVAIAAAAAVLFGCAYFSSRREARKAGLSLLGVAAIVLVFAGGYGSGANHAVAGGEGGGGGGGGGGGQVAVSAAEFAYTPNDVTVPAGVIKITLTNAGRSLHTLLFDNVGKFKKLVAPPGLSASGEVQLKPGSYTFYCSELGHRGSGMQGKLTVTKPGKG
jgi:plastocyanin